MQCFCKGEREGGEAEQSEAKEERDFPFLWEFVAKRLSNSRAAWSSPRPAFIPVAATEESAANVLVTPKRKPSPSVPFSFSSHYKQVSTQ